MIGTIGERLARSHELQRLHPYSMTCGRCRTPYPCTTFHDTAYQWRATPRNGRRPIIAYASAGMLPLCEDCWQELRTPSARLPFYILLMEEWNALGCVREGLTPAFLLECLELETET